MLRFFIIDAFKCFSTKNKVATSRHFQIYLHSGFQVRICHNSLSAVNTKSSPESAKSIINDTFNSVSQRLKCPSLKPVFTSTAIHSKDNVTWKSSLTLKCPEEMCFVAIGKNKKESEELVAQQALNSLRNAKKLSSAGKPLIDLKTLQSLQNSVLTHTKTNKEPVSKSEPVSNTGDNVKNITDLIETEKQFPNFKTTLLNCIRKVSNHVNDSNLIVRPTFKRVGSNWQATYKLKWPVSQEFSGIGKHRRTAEKWAILSALHWLLTNEFIHPSGYPLLYSDEELSAWKINSRSPAVVTVPPQLAEKLEKLLCEFKELKPLLDENRKASYMNTRSLIPEDEEGLEEIEEERELEESLGNLPGNDKRMDNDTNDSAPFDPITGRRLSPHNPREIKKRCEKLFISAKARLLDHSGPVIPYLPIQERREEILKLIENNRVIVLSGGTGCGKSTQIPQYLLDSYALERRGADCNIIVTQPRRLAALALAQTVASHRGEKVGESVGYQVRLNSVLPKQPKGRILFCSTGILLRRIQSCPELTGVSHLIIDEVHERDCLTDFVLVLIKDLLRVNTSLKVILMSASLNAELLSNYFDCAPLVHVNGKTFPVQKYFLDDIQRMLLHRAKPAERKELTDKPLVDLDLLLKLIRYVDREKPTKGSILCFLPGWADIKILHSKLKEFYPSEETHWILPVHSRLSQTEQERIFDRPPDGVRKIVLATNIAETSLTINDCVYVIDPGIHKELRYNPKRGSAIMENQWISKANVQQRAGRAGRVQPGESYHLYSHEKYENMESFPLAEILRIPLEKVVMDIKAYDENLSPIDFLSRTLESPPRPAIESALYELESIGALDEQERLTPLGRRIAQFSTHPRLAKSLVFATLFRCLDPVASAISGLSSSRECWAIDSVVDNQRQLIRQAKQQFHPTSDHLALANVLKVFREKHGRYNVDEFCRQAQVNPKSLYFLKGVRGLLVDHLKEADLVCNREDADSAYHPLNAHANNEEMVKAALMSGFGDRVLRVRRGKLVKGIIKPDEISVFSGKHGLVHVASDSVNGDGRFVSDFVMYFNGIYSTERKAFVVRDTTQISNVTALLTTGKSITKKNCPEENNESTNVVLTIDDCNHIDFSCSPREAQLLMEFRTNLAETCDYLLRNAGLRQMDELSMNVENFHTQFVELLACLLSKPKQLDEIK